MVTGYSDRINHAFAFAAKHHDRQVQKGMRLPYLTHAPNVAVILTRYGQDEQTVVAGILHDVVEDCVRESHSRDTLMQRMGDKFGEDVVDTLLSVSIRTTDDDGVQLAADEQREDMLDRLAKASDRARWICAADQLHDASTLLADLRRTIDPDTVWSRFAAGRESTARWYRRVHDRLREVGFSAPIMDELLAVSGQLERELAAGAEAGDG